MNDGPVVFEVLRGRAGGGAVGVATLNAPGALNALSLPMVDLLDAQLAAWATDPGIGMVVLRGAGERAFCAGGDLHALYASMRDAGAAAGRPVDPLANPHAAAFFAREYRLDHRIHAYPKPVLCWGHGIVMGGGIGLMAGASHRVVTPESRLAMPEIGIGLFPDVGGSWLLSRAPGASGRFLALTGAHIGAADAIYAGFADCLIAGHGLDEVLTALIGIEWTGQLDRDRAQVDAVLDRFTSATETTPGPLERLRTQVDASCSGSSLEAAVERIAAAALDDPWWQRAQANLARGCPSSIRLSWALQERSTRLSLAEVFRLEYIAALHCAAHGDFAEGIRALLIDKDRQPDWSPARLDQAGPDFIAGFFRPPWAAGAHPLADLGAQDAQRAGLA